MILQSSKEFEKQYKKLDKKIQEKIKGAISRFVVNPFDPLLHNHRLHGRMQNMKSFSVTGDIRIIFEDHKNYTLVVLLSVGGHGKIYK